MLHIILQYGRAVATLPALPAAALERATADDLRILIHICTPGAPMSAESSEAYLDELAAHTGISPVRLSSSLAFWRGAGVLDMQETETATAPAIPQKPAVTAPAPREADPGEGESPTAALRRARAQEKLPHYNTEDMNAYLEANHDARAHIDECNRLWGDMLNIREINTLIVLRDYMSLEWDYILCLVARCVDELGSRGSRPSMHYVEKTAISYYDEGIRTMDALLEKFRALDLFKSTEGRLRTLFGMGDRRMTPNETKYFSTWLYEFKFDYEIIELAYNVTVDTKGKPQMSYINSVLANWNRDELRTPAAIEAAMAAHRAESEKKRTGAKPSAPATSSFDTDDFFGAAVRRSLGDDFDPSKP